MSRSRSVRPVENPARPAPVTRGLLVRLGLYWGTLFMLAVGSCTLTFWLIAGASSFFNVGAQELFLIRAVGLIALALGAAGIFFIVAALRRVSLPIDEMTRSAERIAQGDYSARVQEQGPRELRSLARSFNRMAEQLHENDAARRTLIGNIANELRTPLTMLQENIEGLLDGNFARDDAHLNLILGETIRLSHLTDEMRMLALAESGGLILQRELVDLNALARETVALYHRDASQRQISLHAILPDEAYLIYADPARIRQALGNLLEDALRSNLKSDLRVEVTKLEAAPPKTSAYAQVEVAYRAAVIAPELLAGYFDRFYQSNPAPNADSGLGLAISKLLIQAHGGAIAVASDAR
ncbi:MAG: hypothetical protein DCC52_09220, partial [Chloroflexi bacterium]